MVVLTMTDCPPKLRGDLSKWLCEINTGVYVGKVSARVRDELWDRVRENISQGKATMVYTAANEQGMEFRTHNTTWQPVDFDGLRLMRRPLPKEKTAEEGKSAYVSYSSKAGKIQKARRINASRKSRNRGFAVVDLETSGLSPQKDEIIEVGALRIVDGKKSDEFSALILPEKQLPEEVSRLTGITQEELEQKGGTLSKVLKAFLEFVQGCPLVFHNAAFDCAFLEKACRENGLEFPNCKCMDTLQMAKRQLDGVKNYKLETVAAYFGYTDAQKHRALQDCEMTLFVYNKLNELDETGF